jgi:hypothetical protein
MISETFLARQRRQARLALPMALLLLCPLTGMAQRDRNSNYYRGMNQQVRRGDYNRYVQDDDRRHHHHDDHDSGGGIGPGKAAMIGGAGGAALGAIFGKSLKGTLIGGAAGAGLGAIGGAIANHDSDHDRHHR